LIVKCFFLDDEEHPRYHDVYKHMHRHHGGIPVLRTQIQLAEDQMNWLREKARERGVSVSQLIREGIDLFRAHQERLPEDKKKARNAMNYKLKNLGFYPIQKSVFVFPYECRDEIDFVGNFYNIRKNIRYIEVKDIDDDGKLRKKFCL